MSVVKIKSLTKEAQKKEIISDWNINFDSATINAFCTQTPESILALFQLIMGKDKDARNAVQIGDFDAYKHRKQLASQIGYLGAEIQLGKRGTVLQLLTTAIKKSEHPVTMDQAKKIVKQFGIELTAKVVELTEAQQQQLEIILFTVQKLPLLLLEQPTSRMDAKQTKLTWQLLSDYTQKTKATVLFFSSHFEEMQQYADQIVYVRNGRITQQHQLPTHDSVDCVVTVTGTGFPIELAQSLGAHIVEEAERETKFIFSGTIQVLLPLLEQTGITDVRIEDATIEDELMIY